MFYMKTSKSVLALALASTVLMSCGNAVQEKEPDSCEVSVNWDGVEKDAPFADEFTDFEIFPLGSTQDCLLGNPIKLVVTDSAFYILDYAQNQRILAFSTDGSYLGKIGESGHSSSEYVSIQNFNANEKGDSVAVIDQDCIKLYDRTGHFLSSKKAVTAYGGDDILLVPGGFYTAMFHRFQDNHMAVFYDLHSGENKAFIDVDTDVIGHNHHAANLHALQRDGSKICLLDVFSSTFFLLNNGQSGAISRYTLTSPGMMTEDKARELVNNGNPTDVPDEAVNSYIFAEGAIWGTMLRSHRQYDFHLSLDDGELTLYCHTPMSYDFAAYHGGYFYKLIPAEHLLDIMNVAKPYMQDIHDMLKDAFTPLTDSIKEDDNFYILRMRLR